MSPFPMDTFRWSEVWMLYRMCLLLSNKYIFRNLYLKMIIIWCTWSCADVFSTWNLCADVFRSEDVSTFEEKWPCHKSLHYWCRGEQCLFWKTYFNYYTIKDKQHHKEKYFLNMNSFEEKQPHHKALVSIYFLSYFILGSDATL